MNHGCLWQSADGIAATLSASAGNTLCASVRPPRSRIATTTGGRFARLVLGEPAINPISGQVLRPDMAAEIGAVDLGRPVPRRQYAAPSCWKPWPRAVCAPARTPSCIAHRGSREKASMLLPLHLVAKHRDSHQVALERQLFVPGEQGARGYREIGATRSCSASAADWPSGGNRSRSGSTQLGTDRLTIGSAANAGAGTRFPRRDRTFASPLPGFSERGVAADNNRKCWANRAPRR